MNPARAAAGRYFCVNVDERRQGSTGQWSQESALVRDGRSAMSASQHQSWGSPLVSAEWW